MLILNCKGVPVGKVIRKNGLRTSDESLATIWRKHIVQVSHAPEGSCTGSFMENEREGVFRKSWLAG